MDVQLQIAENLKALTDSMKTIGSGMESLNKRLEDEAKKREALEAQLKDMGAVVQTKVKRDVTVPGSNLKNDGRYFSFMRAARGIVYGDWRGADFERECFAMADEQSYGISRAERDNGQIAKRDMTTSNDQLGGYLVPTQVLSSFFIDELRPNIVVEAMGATVMDNLVGSPVEIPRQQGGATAFWTGENQAITPSDLNLGQINLQPRCVAALVKMSTRLQRMSMPAAEQLVRYDMGTAIAEAIDLAALRGSGASGEPVGIANVPGINTVVLGANGGFFNFTAADLMRQALAVDNALKGRLGFVWHPAIGGKLRRERIAQFTNQTDGAYVTLPMSDQMLRDQLGWQFMETTQIPTDLTKGSGTNLSEIYFANWAELVIGIWMNLELDASREAGDAFEKNQVWLKATVEADIAMRHLESFCLVSDAQTV